MALQFFRLRRESEQGILYTAGHHWWDLEQCSRTQRHALSYHVYSRPNTSSRRWRGQSWRLQAATASQSKLIDVAEERLDSKSSKALILKL